MRHRGGEVLNISRQTKASADFWIPQLRFLAGLVDMVRHLGLSVKDD